MKIRQQIKQIRPETIIDRSFVYAIFWFFCHRALYYSDSSLFSHAGEFAFTRVSLHSDGKAGFKMGAFPHSRRMVCSQCGAALRVLLD